MYLSYSKFCPKYLSPQPVVIFFFILQLLLLQPFNFILLQINLFMLIVLKTIGIYEKDNRIPKKEKKTILLSLLMLLRNILKYDYFSCFFVLLLSRFAIVLLNNSGECYRDNILYRC